jgi:hypothetical protein
MPFTYDSDVALWDIIGAWIAIESQQQPSIQSLENANAPLEKSRFPAQNRTRRIALSLKPPFHRLSSSRCTAHRIGTSHTHHDECQRERQFISLPLAARPIFGEQPPVFFLEIHHSYAASVIAARKILFVWSQAAIYDKGRERGSPVSVLWHLVRKLER